MGKKESSYEIIKTCYLAWRYNSLDNKERRRVGSSGGIPGIMRIPKVLRIKENVDLYFLLHLIRFTKSINSRFFRAYSEAT